MNKPEPDMKMRSRLNHQQTLPLVIVYPGIQRDPVQGNESLLENQKHPHRPVRYQSYRCHDRSTGHHLLADPTLDHRPNHQAQQQAITDAAAAAAREAAYEQQQRQGFFGQQIAPFSGGFGAQQQFSTTTQPPPSTLNTILGVGTMAGGLLGGIGSFLGGRPA